MNQIPDLSDDIRAALGVPRYRAGAKFVVKHKWFLLFVAVPTLLAGIYYGLIASDQYVSESRFVVKSPGQRGGQISSIASLIQTTGLSRGQEETSSVTDYIQSRDALADLKSEIDVRKIYADAQADRLSRYPRIFRDPLKFENLYDYYQGKVDVHSDMSSGLAVLSVKAFKPGDAEKLNEKLLTLSERLVNKLNQRAYETAISEAESRVRDAQIRVSNARIALVKFRNSEGLLDPQTQAAGMFDVITELTLRKAALQAQLDQMRMQTPDNPSLSSLQTRVAAISSELNGIMSKVVGSGSAISSKLARYESLSIEQQFATNMLTVANAELEDARTDAQKQHFYLERVVEPNRPDLALYPQRLFSIFTVFGCALCLYFVGWMLIVGILEHAPDN